MKRQTANGQTLLALLVASLILLGVPFELFAQNKPDQNRATHHDESDQALIEKLDQLQAKARELEQAIRERVPGGAMMMARPSGMANTDSDREMPDQEMGGTNQSCCQMGTNQSMCQMGKDQMQGMNAMRPMEGMGPKMGMGSMESKSPEVPGMNKQGNPMGMEMMDMMGKMGGAAPMNHLGPAISIESALPGFPGASHIYHIGATGFFLNHPEHISLSTEQQSQLNRIKEKAALEERDFARKIDQAEEELWKLTAADQPDLSQIDTKVTEIEKLRGDERVGFIKAVGEAAKVLTDDQRKALTGSVPPQPQPSLSPAQR